MSSSIKKDVKFSVKAVINKQKTKVLFAEIDRDLADVLFSFLTLPLGQVVRVLEKHYGDKTPVVGSLTTLYSSLSNLDGLQIWAEGWKQMLLNPVSSFGNECFWLKLDIAGTGTGNQPLKYLICPDLKCIGRKFAGSYYGTVFCDCGKQMTKKVVLDSYPNYPKIDDDAADDDDDGGAFTTSTSAFIISDDLEILPNSSTSVMKIVSKLGLVDANGTEFRNLTFGFNEIMHLLICSLLGTSPLTCLILEKPMTSERVQFQMKMIEKSACFCNVKVIFQKSTGELLFVEAEEDFVDFLFSLLVLPLGKVESLLGGNTGLKNIDNVYQSLSFPINCKYLREVERAKLIDPTIPYGYVSRNCIFPLFEKFATETHSYGETILSPVPLSYYSVVFEGNYVRGPSKLMVNDDLTVTPFSMTSYLSTINGQNIPFSDVDELTLEIGLQEASNILKASLSSTYALSKGLSHLLMKLPKQENMVKQESILVQMFDEYLVR